MKRRTLPFAVALSIALFACGAQKPPAPVEPRVEEVVSDAGPSQPIDAAPPPTLYERLGGKEGVDAIADSFSKNLLADPRVNKAFKKSKDGLAHFKQMLAEQICQLAGGPCQYSGKDMKDAHKGMGITDAQFDDVVEDLKLALDEKGAPEQDKSELFAALAPMRARHRREERGEEVKATSDAILRPEQAAYLEALEPPRDALLAKIEAIAAERGNPISDPEVASFLAITVAARAPKLVVELGTNIGYGAIVLARAAGPAAKVITIELAHRHVLAARAFIEEAGLAAQIEVRQGAAISRAREDRRADRSRLRRLRERGVPALPGAPRAASWPRAASSSRTTSCGEASSRRETRCRRTSASEPKPCAPSTSRSSSIPQLRGLVLPLGDGVGYADQEGVEARVRLRSHPPPPRRARSTRLVLDGALVPALLVRARDHRLRFRPAMHQERRRCRAGTARRSASAIA